MFLVAYHVIYAIQLIQIVIYATQMPVQHVILVTIYKLGNVKHAQLNSQIVTPVILIHVKYAQQDIISTRLIVKHVNLNMITVHYVIQLLAQIVKLATSYNPIHVNSVHLNIHQIVTLVILIHALPA